MNHKLNVAQRDQREAAIAENQQLYRLATRDKRNVEVTAGAAVRRMRELANRQFDALRRGDAGLCAHIWNNPDSPRPAIVPLGGTPLPGNPAAALCWSCWMELCLEVRDSDWDRTCDYCGVVDRSGLHAISAIHGPITFMGGLCDECIADR